jgi:hypothetical protein
VALRHCSTYRSLALKRESSLSVRDMATNPHRTERGVTITSSQMTRIVVLRPKPMLSLTASLWILDMESFEDRRTRAVALGMRTTDHLAFDALLRMRRARPNDSGLGELAAVVAGSESTIHSWEAK